MPEMSGKLKSNPAKTNNLKYIICFFWGGRKFKILIPPQKIFKYPPGQQNTFTGLLPLLQGVKDWELEDSAHQPVIVVSTDGRSKVGVYTLLSYCRDQIQRENEFDIIQERKLTYQIKNRIRLIFIYQFSTYKLPAFVKGGGQKLKVLGRIDTTIQNYITRKLREFHFTKSSLDQFFLQSSSS